MSERFIWSDLERLVTSAGVPVVVKGVLYQADVRRAADCGVAAVVVSNHGGRVHDGLVGAIDALADLSSVGPPVGWQMPPLFVDGGIESGADVVRALALGATGVLLGRRVLWTLAAGGEGAVRRIARADHGRPGAGDGGDRGGDARRHHARPCPPRRREQPDQ